MQAGSNAVAADEVRNQVFNVFRYIMTISSDTVLRRIAIGVLCVHAALLLWSAFIVRERQLPLITPKERLIVKTVSLNSSPTIIAIAEPKAASPEVIAPELEPIEQPQPVEEPPPPEVVPEVVAEVISAPKTEVIEPHAPPKPKPKKKKEPPPKRKEKPVDKKKETPPKDSVKTSPNAEKKEIPTKKLEPKQETAKVAQEKRRALLAQAKKKIAQIEQGHATLSDNSALPTKIGALHVEAMGKEEKATLTSQEVIYYEELASRLKLKLRLPEYGEVKIKLTLAREGKFVKVMIISAASQKNRQYIEKMLPTLSYPTFGKNFSGAGQYTFTIALSNEF